MDKKVFDRLVVEHDELVDKFVKLRDFILINPEFNKLDEENRGLLRAQLDVQRRYIDILIKRIEINRERLE